MEGFYILLLISLGSCVSEWVLIPSVFQNQNEVKDKFSTGFSLTNSNYERNEICPDFHNLTTMTYGSLFREKIRPQTGWEISLEDVEELLKENENLPRTFKEKVNLVKQMEDDLMTAAEQQIKTLFSPSREARTKYFHFGSMEGALMTISILLFGVYLSKVILKLLLSHYNRYNGGTAMMTGIRAPITFAHGRKERSIQLRKIQLMHLIDKYDSQFNKSNYYNRKLKLEKNYES